MYTSYKPNAKLLLLSPPILFTISFLVFHFNNGIGLNGYTHDYGLPVETSIVFASVFTVGNLGLLGFVFRKSLPVKKIVLGLLLGTIIFVSIFTGIKFPVANALSPALAFDSVKIVTTPGSSIVFSAVNGPSGLISTFNQGAYVLHSICTPSTVRISGITDTITPADTWLQVIPNTPLPEGTGSHTMVGDWWFVNIPVSTTTVTETITIQYAPNYAACYVVLFIATSTSIAIATQSYTASIIGRCRTVFGTNCVGPAIPVFSSTVLSNVVNVPSNSLVIANTWGNVSSGNGELVSVTSTAPLVNFVATGSFQNAAGFSTDLLYYQTSSFFSGSTSTNQKFSWTASSNKALEQAYILAAQLVVFNPTGGLPPTCSGPCNITNGGNGQSSNTFLAVGNVTYLYQIDSPVGGGFIFNLTSKIQSYNNAGAGKINDFVYLTIYQMSSGNKFETTPVSGGNPYNLVFSSGTGAGQILVPTGSVNFKLTRNPSIAILSNTSFAIGIMSRFAGMVLYQTTTPVQLYNDSVDKSVLGIPPAQLTAASNSYPAIFLFSQMAITPTSTSVTSGGGSTTITTVGTVTSFIFSLTGGLGSVAILQNLLTYFPIWILPLLFSPFGIQGVMIGLIAGVSMGGILGIIPLWVAFLLALGIAYLLIKRF